MDYLKLGRTGLEVSRFCFGCWTACERSRKIDQFAAVVLIANGPGHLLLAAHQAWISVPVNDLSYVI